MFRVKPSVIAAEQLQGHLVLLGEGFAGHKQHSAGKFVEVVAHDRRDSVWAAHGSVDLPEEGERPLVGRGARAVLQLHVVDVRTWSTTNGGRRETRSLDAMTKLSAPLPLMT